MDDRKLPPPPDGQGQTQQSQPYGAQPQQGDPGQPDWVPPPPQAEQGTVPPPPYPTYGAGQQPQPYPYPPYGPQAPAPTAQPVTSRRTIWIIIGTVLAVILWSIAYAVGGEPRNFAVIGLAIAPLAILAALAYAGARSTVAAVFCYIWLAIVVFGMILNALTSVLLAEVQDFALFRGVLEDPTLARTTPLSDLFKPDTGPVLLWTIILMGLALLVSAMMLLRPVRVLMSRIMPIDPNNFVHKIALCVLTFLFLSSLAPLIALDGRPPLLEAIKQAGSQTSAEDLGLSTGPLQLVYQFVWTIPATLVAAGWPIARRFRATLERLGMVRPSLMQVAAGVGLGLGLAVVASLVVDPAIHNIWTSLGWATTDTAAFEKLLSQLITPLGALVIGVTAGVGEEMAVRGLLQPRIGLIASNLVFTSLHVFQYGPDALLSVFIIGLILGIIRARSNTTTSAIVHGVYDFTLILAASLSGP